MKASGLSSSTDKERISWLEDQVRLQSIQIAELQAALQLRSTAYKFRKTLEMFAPANEYKFISSWLN